MDSIVVAKFGGSSLADAGQFQKVLSIVRSDERRRFVVVSAPGKSNRYKTKVTDELIALKLHQYEQNQQVGLASKIRCRYSDIVRELGCSVDFGDDMHFLGRPTAYSEDYVKSRGEYLNAKIFAVLSGYAFIDAANVIKFGHDGKLDMNACREARDMLLSIEGGCVIPGYYGAMPNGDIKTFSRGGSDLTGSIIAAILGAELYENWTDVSGFYTADPRVVPTARPIVSMTYEEGGELAYQGASVLHPEATFPAEDAGIPIRVLNTNRPEDPGTLIAPDSKLGERSDGPVVGIAARQDFMAIRLKKALMGPEVGFIHRLTGVLSRHGINIEHMPGGLRTIDCIVERAQVDGKSGALIAEIEKDCGPVKITTQYDIALICVVGQRMMSKPGFLERVSGAVARVGVSVKMVDQGLEENDIILGVARDDCAKAMKSIHDEFFGPL